MLCFWSVRAITDVVPIFRSLLVESVFLNSASQFTEYIDKFSATHGNGLSDNCNIDVDLKALNWL